MKNKTVNVFKIDNQIFQFNASQGFIYFVLLFPFLISNIRMRDTLPGYDYLNILQFFPRSLIYGLIFVLLISSYIRYGVKKRTLISNYYIIGIVYLVILFSVVNSGDLISTIQGIFYFLSPLLVFQIVYNFPKKFLDLDKAINFYLCFLTINIPIAIYLYITYGLTNDFSNYNPYDVVSGLFAESHAFAVFILFGMALIVYRIAQTNELKYKLFLVISIIVGVICYNEKLMVFLIVVLFIYFIFKLKGYVKIKVVLVLFTLLMGIQVYSIIENRLGIITNYSLLDLPVITSYENAAEVFYNKPFYLASGAGFGEYGTVMVQSKVREGNFPELAKEYNYEYIMRIVDPNALPSNTLTSLASSIQIALNTISSFLVEAGLMVFSLVAFFYLILLKRLWYTKSLNKPIAVLKKCLGLYLICIMLYGNVTIFGSFDDFVTTIPFVVISALIFRKENNTEHIFIKNEKK